jgi:hypothetical protein
MSIPQWQLDLVQKRLQDAGNAAVFWERGTTYGDKEKNWINTCDAFVIVLPEFAWQYVRTSLPKGCKTELEQAVFQNKSIYIAYRTQTNNSLAVYKADLSVNAHIRGVPQTYDSLGQSSLKAMSFEKPVGKPSQLMQLSEVVKMHDTLEDSKIVEYCCTFEFEFHSYDRRLLLLM